jgi:hypothetical protein
MKLHRYRVFLEEAELNLAELSKDRAGQKRGDILVNKLKSKSEITLNNNRPVVVDKMKDETGWSEPGEVVDNQITTDGKYDVDKAKDYFTQGTRYKNVFKEKDGTEFRLNQFKKTTDFGSSGPGRLLNEFETLQCLFLAIKQLNPSEALNIENVRRNFKKYLDDAKNLIFVNNKQEINEELFDLFADSQDWLSTFYRIPNRMYSSLYNYLDRSKQYRIYHTSYKETDSPFVRIKNKYKELSKSGGFGSIDFHKFLPSDAYLISVQHQNVILSEINNCKTIDELVKYLDSVFDDKKLVSISLKKIGYKKDYKIIINKEIDKSLPDFYLKYFVIGEDMRGIGSQIFTRSFWKHRKNKVVDVKDRKITIDSSDTSKRNNIDAEIEGSKSRHGKISFTSLKRLISQYEGLAELQSYKELESYDLEDLRKMVKLLKVEITQQSSAATRSEITVVVPFNRAKDISDSKNKLISRIQSMQVVLSLLQLHTIDSEECDRLITKIMRFALSIETDMFSTPRYFRVI